MIEIVKTKELKSTTKVEGIMVLMSNGEWYGITRLMPARSPWIIRGSSSTRTGRLSNTDIFTKMCTSKPDLLEGIGILKEILNGKEPIKDKFIV